ncbi:MAG: hypothetical protein FJX32_15950 [Alphaproteobacteria bacterium]|nr:hypothetical protein [Alphaproteobacteria bacterium]
MATVGVVAPAPRPMGLAAGALLGLVAQAAWRVVAGAAAQAWAGVLMLAAAAAPPVALAGPRRRRRIEDNVETLLFNLQGAMAGRPWVEFQENHHGSQQMHQDRRENRPRAQAWPLWAQPAYGPAPPSVRRAAGRQFGFGAAHGGGERVLTR